MITRMVRLIGRARQRRGPGGTQSGRHGRRRMAAGALAILAVGALLAGSASAKLHSQDEVIARSLADLLRAARSVIASNQDLINDPKIGDKGLSGDVVLDRAIENYRKATNEDPRDVDPDSRRGRLLAAQMAAIREVMQENQAQINEAGVGFKGFVPAVFARLVNERFAEKVGREARIKVTAPRDLVRNRKALPDDWESRMFEDKLRSADWPQGQVLFAERASAGRQAFRFLVPEYYSAGCLSCHGKPKGEIDITGYPKEGGDLGELGGAISITLFR